jgi:hypothetical protein
MLATYLFLAPGYEWVGSIPSLPLCSPLWLLRRVLGWPLLLTHIYRLYVPKLEFSVRKFAFYEKVILHMRYEKNIKCVVGKKELCCRVGLNFSHLVGIWKKWLVTVIYSVLHINFWEHLRNQKCELTNVILGGFFVGYFYVRKYNFLLGLS